MHLGARGLQDAWVWSLPRGRGHSGAGRGLTKTGKARLTGGVILSGEEPGAGMGLKGDTHTPGTPQAFGRLQGH